MKKLLLILTGLAFGCGQQSHDDRVTHTHSGGAELKNAQQANGSPDKGLTKTSIPTTAQSLHQKGRAEGAAGRYDSALELFSQAAEAAPNWSYPLYDMAFTHLLKGDFTNALARYRVVDTREPGGFFSTKTAIWTLEREQSGMFPAGTYAALVSVESATTVTEKQKRIDQLAAKAPQYPPVFKEKAFLTTDLTQRLKYLDQALSLNPDLETYGVVMLNRAVVLDAQGRNAEARTILNALLSGTNTTSTKALASDVLKKL